ncbi:hypothetical protein F67_I3_11_001 [Rhizobium phage RHph_I3_11]|nr:hypothetical protein F67_I3_11_001 [Rhizobium phage RHph_I3_11]
MKIDMQIYVGNETRIFKVAEINFDMSLSKEEKEEIAKEIGSRLSKYTGNPDYHTWHDAEKLPSEIFAY